MTAPLFPDLIPVTEQEVKDWLDKIPNLSKSEFRRQAYRKAYRVDDKIRSLKLERLRTESRKKHGPRRTRIYKGTARLES